MWLAMIYQTAKNPRKNGSLIERSERKKP